MKEKIALVTVSGKAYYLLVCELKKKKLPFLSLTPQEQIPLEIKVVITTEKERHQITHPNVLVFKDEDNPTVIVEEAERIIKGKQSYEKLVVGVDPGKTFGIAVIGDRTLLETINCQSVDETVKSILGILNKTPAASKVVKIGDGAPTYMQQLLNVLDKTLQKDVFIEIVSEAGTSRFPTETKHRRDIRDMMSAAKIAGRNGQPFTRKGKGEKR